MSDLNTINNNVRHVQDTLGRIEQKLEALSVGRPSSTMTEAEASVIERALEWAAYFYESDQLNQPTKKPAGKVLDGLYEACADLQAESDGEWKRRG